MAPGKLFCASSLCVNGSVKLALQKPALFARGLHYQATAVLKAKTQKVLETPYDKRVAFLLLASFLNASLGHRVATCLNVVGVVMA